MWLTALILFSLLVIREIVWVFLVLIYRYSVQSAIGLQIVELGGNDLLPSAFQSLVMSLSGQVTIAKFILDDYFPIMFTDYERQLQQLHNTNQYTFENRQKIGVLTIINIFKQETLVKPEDLYSASACMKNTV